LQGRRLDSHPIKGTIPGIPKRLLHHKNLERIPSRIWNTRYQVWFHPSNPLKTQTLTLNIYKMKKKNSGLFLGSLQCYFGIEDTIKKNFFEQNNQVYTIIFFTNAR
jgi:hypothetical protein